MLFYIKIYNISHENRKPIVTVSDICGVKMWQQEANNETDIADDVLLITSPIKFTQKTTVLLLPVLKVNTRVINIYSL